MSTIDDLIKKLDRLYEDVEGDVIKTGKADSMANIAGKQINAARAEHDYKERKDKSVYVRFLDTPDKPAQSAN